MAYIVRNGVTILHDDYLTKKVSMLALTGVLGDLKWESDFG